MTDKRAASETPSMPEEPAWVDLFRNGRLPTVFTPAAIARDYDALRAYASAARAEADAGKRERDAAIEELRDYKERFTDGQNARPK